MRILARQKRPVYQDSSFADGTTIRHAVTYEETVTLSIPTREGTVYPNETINLLGRTVLLESVELRGDEQIVVAEYIDFASKNYCELRNLALELRFAAGLEPDERAWWH